MINRAPRLLRLTASSLLLGALLVSTAAASTGTPADTTGKLTVNVNGLPAGAIAAVVITGPSGFSRTVVESQTLSDLAPGAYTVSARLVVFSGTTYNPTPDSQLVVVRVDSTSVATIEYAPPLLSATVAVSISGLPAMLNANVTIAALGGFIRAIARSDTVRGVLPGRYALTAAYVIDGSTAYAPVQGRRVITVVPGTVTAVEVVYEVAPPGSHDMLSAGFQPRSIMFLGAIHNYEIFVPRTYTPTVAWPVILFAHGSAEGGANNTAQLGVGLGPYVRANAATFPAIVVFPQKLATQSVIEFDSMMVVMLDATMREANVDSTRQYLTGVSSGGARTWALAYHHPDRFAALAPMAALVTPSEFDAAGQDAAVSLAARALRTLPIRQYNGSNDTQIPITTFAYPLREAFQAVGAPNYQFFEIAGAGHGATWDIAYADPGFWSWLFAQHR